MLENVAKFLWILTTESECKFLRIMLENICKFLKIIAENVGKFWGTVIETRLRLCLKLCQCYIPVFSTTIPWIYPRFLSSPARIYPYPLKLTALAFSNIQIQTLNSNDSLRQYFSFWETGQTVDQCTYRHRISLLLNHTCVKLRRFSLNSLKVEWW